MGGDIRGGYGKSYFMEVPKGGGDWVLQEILPSASEATIKFKDGSSVRVLGDQVFDIPYYSEVEVRGSEDSLAALYATAFDQKEDGLDRDKFVSDIEVSDEKIPDIEDIRNTYKWRDEHGQMDLFPSGDLYQKTLLIWGK